MENEPAPIVAATAADPDLAETSQQPDPRRFKALIVIAMAQLMIVLDVSIVNLAIPRAQEDLGISASDVQWIITAYTLTFGGLILLGGRIADYLGRKRMLIVGLLGFAAASLLGGLAPTAGMLFAARGLQGIFAALMAPAALSLISVTFTDPNERAKAFGVFGAVSGAGAAIGLLAGGILTEYFSWRWCLAVNAPIAIVAALLAMRFVRESRATKGRGYDVPGAITVTLGLLALVYGFTQAAPQGPTDSSHWSDPTTVIWFMMAGVLLTMFVTIELRSSSPLLPMRVVLERNRGGAYLSSLFVGAGMLAMFLFLGLYMQTILGYSPVTAGLAFLPFSVGVIIGAGLASNLMPRVSPRYLITPGLIAAALGMTALAQLTPTSNYFPSLFVPMIVISLGIAFVFVPIASVGLHNSGTEDAGVASAMIQTSQQIGGSIGVALMNTVAVTAAATFLAAQAIEGETSAPEALTHGYTSAFYVGASLLIVAAVIVFALIKVGPEALKETNAAQSASG